MAIQTRILVDFWNFQLNWNDRSGPYVRCDWQKLPSSLLQAARSVLDEVGDVSPLELQGTSVHASVNPASQGDLRLLAWLHEFLSRQPGFTVTVRERRTRNKPIHCKSCGSETSACSKCGRPLQRAKEKGLDVGIVTDLVSSTLDGVAELAILVTSDSDFAPAVQWVQGRGTRVINACWEGAGFDLRERCWGSFDLDPLISALVRHTFG